MVAFPIPPPRSRTPNPQKRAQQQRSQKGQLSLSLCHSRAPSTPIETKRTHPPKSSNERQPKTDHQPPSATSALPGRQPPLWRANYRTSQEQQRHSPGRGGKAEERLRYAQERMGISKTDGKRTTRAPTQLCQTQRRNKTEAKAERPTCPKHKDIQEPHPNTSTNQQFNKAHKIEAPLVLLFVYL